MEASIASHIISTFVACGVKMICMAPGSRSCELIAAAARHPLLEKCVHFDERALAFYAYGYAKASQTPVVVMTTSGSAAGNLFPAIMEAFSEQVPLIIVTADRPFWMKDVMANQTCDQLKLFGSYVKHFTHIPAAASLESINWITAEVSYAVHLAHSKTKGPVHINCEFQEPFFEKTHVSCKPLVTYECSHQSLSSQTFEEIAKTISSYQKGIIIAGKMGANPSQTAIFNLANQLNWPVFADPLSGLRGTSCHDTPVIPYYNDLVQALNHVQPDCIIHLGDKFVSKPLEQWLLRFNDAPYYVIADHLVQYDPLGKVTHRIEMDPSIFCETITPYVAAFIDIEKTSSWKDQWKELANSLEQIIDTSMKPISEMGVIRYLHQNIPSGFSYYVANSMPIRDTDRLFFPQKDSIKIWGQRGLSGIDGNIATAAGIQKAVKTPLIVLVGDLALLYDVNALSLIKSFASCLIILVMNNQGGGIFSFLPIQKQTDIFDTYIATKHSYTFEHAAQLFDIPYQVLTDLSQLDQAVQEKQTILIEIRSDQVQNVNEHHALSSRIQTHLNCLISHYDLLQRTPS